MKYVTLQTDIIRVILYTWAVIYVSNGTNLEGSENNPDTYLSRFIADLWLEGTDIVRIIWRDCSKKVVDVKDMIDHKEYYPKFMRCIKRKTLRALDRCLSPDVVPIADGVNLVRFELVDRSGKVVHENETSTWTDKDIEKGEWRNLALQRMAKVLRTHVIKFDFEQNDIVDKVEFRGRRRHQLMTMMMFGIVSIGMVLIPMGFQFLAVLGGKALLLAKMALILASIQGLKKVDAYDAYYEKGKIATSPINYGFYPSYPYDHFDKRSHGWPSSGAVLQYRHLHSPYHESGDIKADRIHVAESVIDKDNIRYKTEVERKMEGKDVKEESRIFPIYTEAVNLPPHTLFDIIDTASPIVDLTTRPGEVQADYALDLPYNGFHFQNPTPVVPT